MGSHYIQLPFDGVLAEVGRMEGRSVSTPLAAFEVIEDSAFDQLGSQAHARFSGTESSSGDEYELNAEDHEDIGTRRFQPGNYRNIPRNASIAAGARNAPTEIDQTKHDRPYLELEDCVIIKKPEGEPERRTTSLKIGKPGRERERERKGYITKDQSRLHPDKYKLIVRTIERAILKEMDIHRTWKVQNTGPAVEAVIQEAKENHPCLRGPHGRRYPGDWVVRDIIKSRLTCLRKKYRKCYDPDLEDGRWAINHATPQRNGSGDSDLGPSGDRVALENRFEALSIRIRQREQLLPSEPQPRGESESRGPSEEVEGLELQYGPACTPIERKVRLSSLEAPSIITSSSRTQPVDRGIQSDLVTPHGSISPVVPQQHFTYEDFDQDMGVGMDMDAPPMTRADPPEAIFFNENECGSALSPPPTTRIPPGSIRTPSGTPETPIGTDNRFSYSNPSQSNRSTSRASTIDRRSRKKREKIIARLLKAQEDIAAAQVAFAKSQQRLGRSQNKLISALLRKSRRH